MIISDTHRFAFIHIPKCAGTTIRSRLKAFDDRDGAYTHFDDPEWARVHRAVEHSALGKLDYQHIPLFMLAEHFPNDFSLLKEYWTFTVVRDPFGRFASSLSQRLKKYCGTPIGSLARNEIETEIRRCIEYLSSRPRSSSVLPPEYIHFQRQSDYVYVNGERVVDTLYTVDEVNQLLADVGRHVGVELCEATNSPSLRANTTLVYRSDLIQHVVRAAGLGRRLALRILPQLIKRYMRDRLLVPRDRRLMELFEQGDVKEFIRDYYAEDIALFERVRHQSLEPTS